MNKISDLILQFKQAGYTFLCAEFTGSGDSGGISALWLSRTHEEQFELLGDPDLFNVLQDDSPWSQHEEFLESFFYQYINRQNYYDDEGGDGTACFNLATLVMEIEWNFYVTSSYVETESIQIEESTLLEES